MSGTSVDTKVALILFIRAGKMSDVVTKAIAEIEGHPNFQRTVIRSKDGERDDFILRPANDPDQEIRLALLPFALQKLLAPCGGLKRPGGPVR